MVYCVIEGIPYEGETLMSVWSTAADADVEAKRLGKESSYCDYEVKEMDVRSAIAPTIIAAVVPERVVSERNTRG